jgi:hypothetical protein
MSTTVEGTMLAKLVDPEEEARKVRGEETPEEEAERLDDPRLAREWEFDFEFTDRRGRKFSGRFKNKILNFAEQAAVDVVRARICGGLPVEAISIDAYNRAMMIAHLNQSLLERPSAKWAQKLSDLDDQQLLERLWEKVASHEAVFHGDQPTEGAGAGDGPDRPRQAAGAKAD